MSDQLYRLYIFQHHLHGLHANICVFTQRLTTLSFGCYWASELSQLFLKLWHERSLAFPHWTCDVVQCCQATLYVQCTFSKFLNTVIIKLIELKLLINDFQFSTKAILMSLLYLKKQRVKHFRDLK